MYFLLDKHKSIHLKMKLLGIVSWKEPYIHRTLYQNIPTNYLFSCVFIYTVISGFFILMRCKTGLARLWLWVKHDKMEARDKTAEKNKRERGFPSFVTESARKMRFVTVSRFKQEFHAHYWGIRSLWNLAVDFQHMKWWYCL